MEKNDSFSIREHREYDFGFRLDLDFQHSFLKDTTEIVYYFEYNIKIMIQISHRDIENKSLIMFLCQFITQKLSFITNISLLTFDIHI